MAGSRCGGFEVGEEDSQELGVREVVYLQGVFVARGTRRRFDMTVSGIQDENVDRWDCLLEGGGESGDAGWVGDIER